MKLFHTTADPSRILRDGFTDEPVSDMFDRKARRGVFLAAHPANIEKGTFGHDVLEVVLPDGIRLNAWSNDGVPDGTDTWRVSAATIRAHGSIRLLTEEEVWEALEGYGS